MLLVLLVDTKIPGVQVTTGSAFGRGEKGEKTNETMQLVLLVDTKIPRV